MKFYMARPNLVKKTAVITGGAGGLGSTMARGLLSCGANVVLLDLDWERLEQAVAVMRKSSPGLVHAVAADVSDPVQVLSALECAQGLTGSIDILVNNAAIGPIALENSPQTKSLRFWESDSELWRRSVDVNVNGGFLMSRGVAPTMIANGWGRIINISTSLSTMQRMGTSPYGVTKAAIEAETKIWSRDLEGTGVTVNTLLPGGAVDTAFVSGATRIAAAAGKIKLLSPDVMIEPLLFLVSREADEVTGQRFVANRWDAALGVAAAISAREPAFAGNEGGTG